MNFGGSLGTPPQLFGAMFNKVADLGMTYVPYKGGAPSLGDLMTGRLQLQFDALTLLQPLIKDGKLRALAVTTPTRWPGLPDVPTLREAGYADFPGNPWAGIMAPAHTPPQIVGKLNATINDVLHSPEAKASLAKLNVLLRPGSPQEFSSFVAEQTPKWQEMVKQSGASAH
jgi:tripartite-type tricarboxylate transporter receptor subunit TctC